MQDDQSGQTEKPNHRSRHSRRSRRRRARPNASTHASTAAPVEVLGRAALTAALAGDGFEVARPERDIGVDLLAFTTAPWIAVPLQMKAATGEVFSVERK